MSRCYSQITLADRRRLRHMVAAKVPVNEMALQLGRHRSTIYREIRRNAFRDRELPDYDGYYSTVANDTAKDRRRRLRKLRRHSTLCTEIINSWRLAGRRNRLPGACCRTASVEFAFVRRQSIASSTARKIMGLVSISIYLRHAENVVQCAPGSRVTVRFQPRTAYPNGPILLEIDRSHARSFTYVGGSCG
jgi:IS30 family transposase